MGSSMGRSTPIAAVAQTRSIRDKNTPSQPVAAPLPVLSKQQAISGKLSRTTGYTPAESLAPPAPASQPSLPPVDSQIGLPVEAATPAAPMAPAQPKPLFKYDSQKVGPQRPVGALNQARRSKTR